ncbi:chromo domain-containing protein cec-1 [Cocos nucifera]|uniref:Chromo domain-containing protein cec-1 n=1 Tax=Cocos nucifera TaxID=13894 RepID=A0A8K0IQK2_COCNU|nr:chromo domain-containing protein cec-1 [Cocos nucifera]
MATSRPRDTHLKEKSNSASSVPRHTDTLHWRRTTGPSVPGSPDRDPHRRPTASKSTTTSISRARSQPPSNATAGRRVPARNPTEKPLSLSGPPRRAPTPNTLKGKTVEASSSLPSAAVSSKAELDKASKPFKSAQTQPLATEKRLGADARKVTGIPTPSTTEAPPEMKSEQEEEPEIPVEKREPVDIPVLKHDSPDELDRTDSSEPNITEDTPDAASQTDQAHEPASTKAEIEIATTNDEGVGADGNKADEDRENPKEPEEKPAIESSEEPKSEPVVDDGKPEEADAEKATTVGSSETKKPEVVALTSPEVAATGRKKDAPRSNDVIEEARGKLMKKRKSKVLALVGAFEAVISLHEPEGQTGQTQGKSQDGEAL